MDYIKVFNEKFIEFLKSLSMVYPDDKDFKLAQTGVRMMTIANETALQKIFHQQAAQYAGYIKSKNDAFFLEKKDYDKDISQSGGNPNEAMDIVEKLKGYWSGLSDENKGIVWKYLNLLIVLDERITS